MSPQEGIDLVLLHQIVEVLELRQEDDEDPERAAALRDLRRLRDRFVHGVMDDSVQVRQATAKVLKYLQSIESTSLGSAHARRLRRTSTSADIAEVLRRSSG